MWEKIERRPYAALALFAFLIFLPGQFSLPPVDRDEARFAQASKQMVESGNLVDIRFQGEPRYKKPAGIYWLQAASAKLLGADAIWAYRLPSFLGAIAAVLLTFWTGKPLFGPRAALIGAGLLAASLLLNVEARLAKTDALLLASIMASLGVLARAYLGEALSWPLALGFWAALGLGILVKGPIAPLVLALTIAPLGFAMQRWAYLKTLRPAAGIALLAVIVAPWAVAVSLATHGAFFTAALGGDLMPKLAGGQESHGAPSGTYLALMLVTFWPGVLFLGPALVEAWGRRKSAPYAFAFAWILPAWLAFEFIPTKLPHYVLPLYPALALLAGAYVAGQITQGPRRPGWLGWGAVLNFVLVALALAAAFLILRPLADGTRSPLDMLPAATLLIVVYGAVLALVRKDVLKAFQGTLAVALIVMTAAFGVFLPGLTAPWISPRVAALLPRDAQGVPAPLVASGYSEPSLVFLAGTGTRFAAPAQAADIVRREPGTVAAIAAPALGDFEAAAGAAGLTLKSIGTVEGYNYSVGKRTALTLYMRGDAP